MRARLHVSMFECAKQVQVRACLWKVWGVSVCDVEFACSVKFEICYMSTVLPGVCLRAPRPLASPLPIHSEPIAILLPLLCEPVSSQLQVGSRQWSSHSDID